MNRKFKNNLKILSASAGFLIVFFCIAGSVFAASVRTRALFSKEDSPIDVEWWTYDAYKEWLDNEKIILQEMLGEKAYTRGSGEFIWTQETIDDTIAQYEGILQDIKNGLKVSKSVDGSDDIMLAQYADYNFVHESSEGAAIVLDNGKTVHFGPYDTRDELLVGLKSYCEEQIQLGNMTEQEADEVFKEFE